MKPTQTWWAAESVSLKRHACPTGAGRSWSTSVVLQGCCRGQKGRFVQHQIVLHSSRNHMKASEWLSFNRHLHTVNTAEEGTSAHWLNTEAQSLWYFLLILISSWPSRDSWTNMIVDVSGGWKTIVWRARLHCVLGFEPSSAAHIPLYSGRLVQHEPTCKGGTKWNDFSSGFMKFLLLIKFLAY